jgi:hypothetical protein
LKASQFEIQVILNWILIFLFGISKSSSEISVLGQKIKVDVVVNGPK